MNLPICFFVSTAKRVLRPLKGVGWVVGIAMLSACAQTGAMSAKGSSPIYYFADCQAGAAPGCVPGNNRNAGTSASAPKQSLDGFNVNTLPAGSQLLFARGGSWNHSLLRLDNRKVSAAQPLDFDAFGAGPDPLFRVSTIYGFEFGEWQNSELDGGYVFRNLKLDGLGKSNWGFWLRGALRDVTIDNVEITGFGIAINSQPGDPISHITVRNSRITRNRDMGVLGNFSDSVFEGNTFSDNNYISGSSLNHAMYLGGGDRNVIRGNTFRNNSVVNGECRGGNLTMHGQMDTMLIENNVITQARASDSCFGISITTGYSTAEYFRNFIVRNNTLVNLGACAICANAVQNFVAENNVIVQDNDRLHIGVMVRPAEQPNDAPLSNVVVRNNTACFKTAASNRSLLSATVNVGESVGNTTLVGASSTTGNCARAVR